jgi:predicted CXXCH cytochrome family protein
MRRWVPFLLLFSTCAVSFIWPQQKSPANNGYVGNQACAKCHAAIVDSYRSTQMANAGGPAMENLIPGEFHHAKSGVNYSIREEDGKVWLNFDRPGDSFAHGQRQLFEFIGQGRRGRTYLFSVDGFVFESPVNCYRDRKVWDMAPAYGNAREIPMTLPALPSCLECHASGFQLPIAGTENRYELPIAAYSGVTCERCHGPGAAHASGSGAIVNPAKLTPARRDNVCMQCHLEGDAAIERQDKHLYEYRPGDDLFDYIRYYVLTRDNSARLGATGQFEALAQSMCKKKSGDAMSCTSCHDPHRSVTPENRVAFYRSKCLACHGEKFAARHHPDRQDCTTCHMPELPSANIAHTQVTDHRIPRRPSVPESIASTQNTSPKLLPFPFSVEADNDVRGKALAWESLVGSGVPGAEAEAERLLKIATTQSSDPAVLAALGYHAQKHGNVERARELYQKALAISPGLIEVENNLGTIEARSGNMRTAARLWQDAFERAPGRSSIGMNLAYEFCEAGQFDAARKYTLRVLQFNPDLGAAKRLMNGLNADPAKCVR